MPLYTVLSKYLIFIDYLSKRSLWRANRRQKSQALYPTEELDHIMLPAEPHMNCSWEMAWDGEEGSREEQTETAARRAANWALLFLSEQVLPTRPTELSKLSKLSTVLSYLGADDGDRSLLGMVVVLSQSAESRTAAGTF